MAKRVKNYKESLKASRHKSVLAILEIYSSRYGKVTPLESKHIHYILNKNPVPDIAIEKYIYKKSYNKKLINNSINGINDVGLHVTPSILQENIDFTHLNRVLNELVDLGWVERIGDQDTDCTYTISPEYYKDSIIGRMNEELNQWHKDYIIVDPIFDDKMRKDGISKKSKRDPKDVAWELCGLPYTLLDIMTKNDKAKLKNHITEIEKHLEQILELKMEYIDLNEFYSLAQTLESNDELVKLTFNALHIGFYYLGYSEMNPEKFWQ